MSDGYISVRNWDTYQHYKNRDPPWIKLHKAILDDPEFEYVPPDQRWALVGLFLMAARMGNRDPDNPKWLEKRIGIVPDLQLLSHWLVMDHASNMLATCKQLASAEGEGEERERELRSPATFAPGHLLFQEPESRKPRKQANHVTQIVDTFAAQYRQHTGQPYTGPGPAADRAQVKRLFTANPKLNPLYVREMVEGFFMGLADPDKDRTGNDAGWGSIVPTVGSFCKHIPKIQKRFTMDEPPEVT